MNKETKCPVVVNWQRCIGCLQCVRTCPKNVLRSQKMKSTVVAPEDCIGCGSCASVCPVGAIQFNGIYPTVISSDSLSSIDMMECIKQSDELYSIDKRNNGNDINNNDNDQIEYIDYIDEKIIKCIIEKAKYILFTDESNYFISREIKCIIDDQKKQQIIGIVGNDETEAFRRWGVFFALILRRCIDSPT